MWQFAFHCLLSLRPPWTKWLGFIINPGTFVVEISLLGDKRPYHLWRNTVECIDIFKYRITSDVEHVFKLFSVQICWSPSLIYAYVICVHMRIFVRAPKILGSANWLLVVSWFMLRFNFNLKRVDLVCPNVQKHGVKWTFIFHIKYVYSASVDMYIANHCLLIAVNL